MADKGVKRGRPPLDAEGGSIKKTYWMENWLVSAIKDKAHDLGISDSEVIRGVLKENLAGYGEDAGGKQRTVSLSLEDPVGRTLRMAADTYGISAEAALRMVLMRSLPTFVAEGKQLSEQLERVRQDDMLCSESDKGY